MRDPDRIQKICNELQRSWKKVPDQRLGQFLLNYVFPQGRDEKGMPDRTNSMMFNQEDDETTDALDKFLYGDR